MNMKQFKYVLVLANRGSFSRAADELHISQPSLSQYIKRIEKELNIVLFDRTGGEVRLTDAGSVYLDAGKRIIEAEKQMQQQFFDLKAYNTGTIIVGIAPTRCQYLMPEIVKRFAKQYPGMRLVIKERFLSELVEDAEHGEFDLCVATLPVDKNKFDCEVMMREEVVLAVPKSMPECEKIRKAATMQVGKLFPAVDVKAIAGARYVSLTATQPTQMQLNNFCAELDISIQAAVECMSIETQYSMVKAGIGLALIPSSIPKYNSSNSLEYYSLMQDVPYRDMAVIHRKEQYLSNAVRALIEIMTSV